MRALAGAARRGVRGLQLRALFAAPTVRSLAARADGARAGPDVLGGRDAVARQARGGGGAPAVRAAARRRGRARGRAVPALWRGRGVGLHASSFALEGGVAPQIYWEWVWGGASEAAAAEAASGGLDARRRRHAR